MLESPGIVHSTALPLSWSRRIRVVRGWGEQRSRRGDGWSEQATDGVGQSHNRPIAPPTRLLGRSFKPRAHPLAAHSVASGRKVYRRETEGTETKGAPAGRLGAASACPPITGPIGRRRPWGATIQQPSCPIAAGLVCERPSPARQRPPRAAGPTSAKQPTAAWPCNDSR